MVTASQLRLFPLKNPRHIFFKDSKFYAFYVELFTHINVNNILIQIICLIHNEMLVTKLVTNI